MDKRNTSRITSSRSLKGATFLLVGWRLASERATWRSTCAFGMSYFDDEYDRLQLSDISMLQCSAQFRILIINAHFVVDNATHALASSATARPTFNVEEEDVVNRNGWTPKEEEDIHVTLNSLLLLVHFDKHFT